MRPSTQNINENISDRPQMSLRRKYRPKMYLRQIRFVPDDFLHESLNHHGEHLKTGSVI